MLQMVAAERIKRDRRATSDDDDFMDMPLGSQSKKTKNHSATREEYDMQ